MSVNDDGPDRRNFLRALGTAGLASAAAQELPAQQPSAPAPPVTGHTASAENRSRITYPRIFRGPQLKSIAFPLGGIAAGSIGLGGRGQLRDWEIFNRPDKGRSPQYAFPSIWISHGNAPPIAHVLEARIEPPYGGQEGLGARNAPGLSRLQGATFTGEFPKAHIDFHDDRLPVRITLSAGTPFIPLDADESGLPLAVLRYRLANTSSSPVTASIAFSIDNPVRVPGPAPANASDTRTNELRNANGLSGIFMRNPGLAEHDPDNGSFAIAVLKPDAGRYTAIRGWPAGRWWDSPLLFWDDFTKDGSLGPEAQKTSSVGALCLQHDIAPGAHAEFVFVLAWHFPNRTPQRCGWTAPKGHEQTLVGNWYSTRFPDAWAVVEYAAEHLERLEQRTEDFVSALRNSTVPSAVKDAASANLSTLVTTTCFRTADGAFHGFEGSNDSLGCCFGNCTHVWNYETATAHLFPSLSQSLRRSAFGYSMDDRGGMYFRQLLPDDIERFGYIAADGQMGQIMKVYMDWQLSGDHAFLAEFWPKVKRAISFAWIKGGWDADRDGVMEGVQHNTYDVEFYGPNPLCGIYYLGALRACEEMARAMQEDPAEYRRLFEQGKAWLDANLFNGSYYIQKVQPAAATSIAEGLRSGMGADDPLSPQYQMGAGCLIDQLLGQYLADVSGLGPLVAPEHIRTTLKSIYRFNHKPNLFDHDSVQRTYALNDESGTVVCDYGRADRPVIPFPYYAELWTGLEHSTAALMLFEGMSKEGLEMVSEVRARYDGERRNPWDEPECGHHYARAMAAWSTFLAASHFRYRGAARRLEITLPPPKEHFQCFWSLPAGWGVFTLSATGFTMAPREGWLIIRELVIPDLWDGKQPTIFYRNQPVAAHAQPLAPHRWAFTLDQELEVAAGASLSVS